MNISTCVHDYIASGATWRRRRHKYDKTTNLCLNGFIAKIEVQNVKIRHYRYLCWQRKTKNTLFDDEIFKRHALEIAKEAEVVDIFLRILKLVNFRSRSSTKQTKQIRNQHFKNNKSRRIQSRKKSKFQFLSSQSWNI